MEKQIAAEVEALLAGCLERINDSLKLVKENCSDEEFQRYRKLASKAMFEIDLNILDPVIYREHPDLRPPELKKSSGK